MKKDCDRCKNNLCAGKVGIFSNLTNDELIEIILMTELDLHLVKEEKLLFPRLKK